MDTTAVERYAVFAQAELETRVRLRCRQFALEPGVQLSPAAESVAGWLLTDAEKSQRAELIAWMGARVREGAEPREAFDRMVERAAWRWFNRVAAIRYMEVHDYLPCHVRLLSDERGAFRPQCLREPDSLGLPGLDPAQALELRRESRDEELFCEVLIAQCDQLAEMMPGVFGRVGAGDRLLLPDGLLDPAGFVGRMVTDIPEADWGDAEHSNVEILGWMYQFYVSGKKDEVFAGFKKGKKAGASEIPPATQLFTPSWIVDYMVQNSLGRVWMLNHPESRLAEAMPYYIAPDPDAPTEDFERVGSPEEITLCDPACGSGHILVAAFRLLARMYEECGYRTRDVPSLILEKIVSCTVLV